MLIRGKWLLCPDGAVRPVLSGEIACGDGTWLQATFQADPAADCTAFSANILKKLHLPVISPPYQLGGVGGVAATILVATQIRFYREDGAEVLFRGQFAAFTDAEALDMSVLGRDISNLFALIVDRPGDFVALVGQRHGYTIHER